MSATMSSLHVDVKATMTSPKSGGDIETSVASTKTYTPSKNYVIEIAFSRCVN